VAGSKFFAPGVEAGADAFDFAEAKAIIVAITRYALYFFVMTFPFSWAGIPMVVDLSAREGELSRLVPPRLWNAQAADA
jgi:hypothetical protein